MQDTAVQSRHVNNCNLQDYYHWKRGNCGSYMVVILLLLFSFPSGEILYFFPIGWKSEQSKPYNTAAKS